MIWFHFFFRNNAQNQPGPNPNVLTGALVGGPSDRWDNWQDDRNDFAANEVATDYNAGFQSAIAGIIQMQCNLKKQHDRQ